MREQEVRSAMAPGARALARIWGRNLRSQRQDRGLTHKALANAIDVDPSLLSKWERGVCAPPYWRRNALADALDVSKAALFPEIAGLIEEAA